MLEIYSPRQLCWEVAPAGGCLGQRALSPREVSFKLWKGWRVQAHSLSLSLFPHLPSLPSVFCQGIKLYEDPHQMPAGVQMFLDIPTPGPELATKQEVTGVEDWGDLKLFSKAKGCPGSKQLRVPWGSLCRGRMVGQDWRGYVGSCRALWELVLVILDGKGFCSELSMCLDGSLALAVVLSRTMTWSAPRAAWLWVLPCASV